MQVSVTPPDSSFINVAITMSDSFKDGWNGNIISIKQKNNVVGKFGQGFTKGSSSGPVYIQI